MYNWFTCKMTFDRQGEDGLRPRANRTAYQGL